MAKTLYEKLFDAHVVYEAENETPLLYIDRHLVHEVTSPQASLLRPKILMPAVKWRASRCRS